MNVVLVVDSEGDVAHCVHEAFAGRGGSYAIIGRTTGREAIAALRDGKAVDVIVCDDRLADVNAVELAGSAKRHAPGVPVIVLSGRPSVEGYLKAVSAGIYDYVARPVDAPTLKRIITAALEERASSGRLAHGGPFLYGHGSARPRSASAERR